MLFADAGSAGTVCPDSSYVEVAYACRYTGSYRTGEPLDIITVSPDGRGDTFAENGISIRVFLRDCDGDPVPGVLAESIKLTSPELCICPGGNIADGPTDAAGSTTFSGTLRAGGCAPNLILQVDGVDISTVPVMTNSADQLYGLPCNIGTDEIAWVNYVIFGRVYSICWDFNKDGVLNVLDWAMFVNLYWSSYCMEGMGR